MKEYEFTEKKVTVNGRKYDAIFPKKHSAITALIFDIINKNADDSYANIPDYHTFCAVIENGTKHWKILCDKPTSDFYIDDTRVGSPGYFKVLFLLEKNKTKELIERKTEIRLLKQQIKSNQKRLRELNR